MSVTSDHSWAVVVFPTLDYTKVTLNRRVGKPMNTFQPRSEANRNRWEEVDCDHCYLRPPEGRQTSKQIDAGRLEIGFTEEADARDWFTWMTKGPAAFGGADQ